jgi:hypothetical protein
VPFYLPFLAWLADAVLNGRLAARFHFGGKQVSLAACVRECAVASQCRVERQTR